MNKILPLLPSLLMPLCVGGQAVETQPSHPNVIFIMADDIGYNDLSAYGQNLFPTPRTQQLASQGLMLTGARAPSSICSPTRYAVLTGTDPFRRYHNSHVLFNAEPLIIREDEKTIAQAFKDLGYTTGVVGKWHIGLGDTLPRDLSHPGRGPNEIGFDYSFIVPDGHNMHPRNYHENGTIYGGEATYESKLQIQHRVGYDLLSHAPPGSGRNWSKWENRRPNEEISETLADKVDAFIESNASGPFFLYYPTTAIHTPLVTGEQFKGKSGIGAHGDFVMEFDWLVGRVMDTLDRLGLSDDTLLIVTSDNGGYWTFEYESESGKRTHNPAAPWRAAKGSTWEGGFRVPFIVRWPGKIPADRVSDQSLSLVDMFSTLVGGAAGGSIPPDAALDSIDVMSQLTDPDSANPDRQFVTGTRGMAHVSLYQGEWKLILKTDDGSVQLYNLDEDPQESNDLSASNPARVEAMRSALNDYFTSGSSRPGAAAEGGELAEILKERDSRNKLIQSLVQQKSD